MSRLLRRRPSPGTVIAFIALFVAMSGVSYGLAGSNTVFGDDIRRNAVGASEIKRNGVRAAEIRRNAVSRAEIRSDAVGPSEVRDDTDAGGGLTGLQINESTLGEVPNAAAADTATTATTATTANSVSANGVNTAAIEDNAVTSAKLGPVTQRETTVVVADPGAGGGTNTATASCLAGEQLLGGGAVWGGTFTAAEAAQLHLVHSRPNVTNWLARGFNDSGANRTLFVRALCLG
jgi:hypothetical protein